MSSSNEGDRPGPSRSGSISTTEREPAPSARGQIPFANWPSIKIVQPPRGRHSPKVDERCFTYCSQTIAGRINKREPWCRSICIRKVFPHEVRNLIAFKDHSNEVLGKDGRAMYPLPPEGQLDDQALSTSSNLGSSDSDMDDMGDGEFTNIVKSATPLTTAAQGRSKNKQSQRYWEEGYYLWLTKSRWAAQERMGLMSYDLAMQSKWMKEKEKRRKAREEWEELEAMGKEKDQREGMTTLPPTTMAQRPPPIVPDTTQSILLPLPPSLPTLTQPLQTLLAPTAKVLVLTKESVNSGAQWKLVGKCWEMAWTGDPLRLAGNACTRMWERWKEGPGEPDGST